MAETFALIDCNSFYCSCEILFQPHLRGKPVIVLSNNDGCAIARTPEAKALGIKMGTPEFQIREDPKLKDVIMFSSNYTLYGDMSHRVQETVREFVKDVEVYSIDELFLKLNEIPQVDLILFGHDLKNKVLQWTGIPTGIGIGPTKTLAKIANNLAKKYGDHYQGVCSLMDEKIRNEILDRYPIEDIWGIGKATKQKLADLGVHTAGHLRDIDKRLSRQFGTVVAERMVLELRGHSCIDLEELPPTRKGTAVTRSFGRPVTSFEELRQAVSTYAARGGEKLRQHGLLASRLTVFAHESKYRSERPYGAKRSCALQPVTNDTRQLIEEAVRLLKPIYGRGGYKFSKAGVFLDDLILETEKPYHMFFKEKSASKNMMNAIDKINAKFGRQSIQFAGMGLEKKWKLRCHRKSPCYTTRLDEVKTVTTG